ncbi:MULTISPECIES: hypothetical protein [Hymenobacter]
MSALVLRFSLLLFVLSFCLPIDSSAALPSLGHKLPFVRAKVKGKAYVHRPNYRRFRAYRSY